MELEQSLNRLGCLLASPAHPSAVSSVFTASFLASDTKILMPNRNFRNVHSHYPNGPALQIISEAADATEVMQSYSHNQISTTHHVGFEPRDPNRGICKPARKINDLEKLPPLNARTAEEITRRAEFLAQARGYAQIRERQEDEVEVQRRLNTASRYPMSTFVLRLDSWHQREGIFPDDVSIPEITPYVTPEPSLRKARICASRTRERLPQSIAGNPTNQPHIRWAPNILQQRQRQLNSSGGQHQTQPVAVVGQRSSNQASSLKAVTTAIPGE